MSVASSIDEQAADVLAVGHNDLMTLQPGAIEVGGYAQEVTNDPKMVGTRMGCSMTIILHFSDN
ncbi:MAG TPA: hypothetical protein VEH04_08120 [Verrucomicrobiae bacterium]|nr:hypothetical protein [Verrucomicrobiae bacterium]